MSTIEVPQFVLCLLVKVYFEGWSIECVCTCESLGVNVHPLNCFHFVSDSQNEVHFIGTVRLGSTGRGGEDRTEQKAVISGTQLRLYEHVVAFQMASPFISPMMASCTK